MEPTDKLPQEPSADVPTGPGASIFGAGFFATVLPERGLQACQGKPEAVPVVKLHLANGTILDLCHIPHMGPGWFAAHYYREIEKCDDMDLAFVPYQLVLLVTVSAQHRSARHLGFDATGAGHVAA